MDNDDFWWHQQDLEMQQYEQYQQLIALFFILLSMEVSRETI